MIDDVSVTNLPFYRCGVGGTRPDILLIFIVIIKLDNLAGDNSGIRVFQRGFCLQSESVRAVDIIIIHPKQVVG